MRNIKLMKEIEQKNLFSSGFSSFATQQENLTSKDDTVTDLSSSGD